MFITVVIALRSDLYKIKIALITMNANVKGEQGVDAFIMLELKAAEAEKQALLPKTIVL